MSQEVENLYLNMEEVCKALTATPSSRNFLEGEAILNSRHLILCEASKKTRTEIHIYALCLQTSSLDSPPHTIEGVIKISKKNYGTVNSISCSCKAGEGSRCKHIAATLLYCNRHNVAEFNLLSSTDKKCLWSERKEPALSQYDPQPLMETKCFSRPSINMPDLTKDMQLFCLSSLMKAVPESALSKHKDRKRSFAPEKVAEVDTLMTTSDDCVEVERALLVLFENLESNELMEWLKGLEISPNHDCCNNVYTEKILCNNPLELCKDTKVVSSGSSENQGMKNVATREMWKKERQFRITGSRCYSVYTYKKNDWARKASNYFWPRPFSNDAVLHGINYQGAARQVYQDENRHVTVFETGLIINKENPWLGYSPDGIVFENGLPTKLLEIKCIVKGKEENICEAIKSCNFITSATGGNGKKVFDLKKSINIMVKSNWAWLY